MNTRTADSARISYGSSETKCKRLSSQWSDLWKAPLHAFPLRDDIVNQFLPLTSDMDVLEIGPGSGFTAFRLARVVRHVTVVDVTSEAVAELSREFSPLPNVRCVREDVCDPGFAALLHQQYDVALGLDVFEYVPDPAGCLSNLASALRSGGGLFLTYPNVPPPRRDGLTHFLHRSDLERLLKGAGFSSWQISTLRLGRVPIVVYRMLYEYPIKALRRFRQSTDSARPPQNYEASWIFRQKNELARYKLAIHLYCSVVGAILHMAGKPYKREPAREDILDQRLLVQAWK